MDETYWNPDPVMGLRDVAQGRGVLCPTTIYLQRNQDRSGVVGLLHPSGEFISKLKSTSGRTFELIDPDFDHYDGLVVWDGAQKCPQALKPIGYLDEEETLPLYQEHSKGLVLGDYQQKNSLWSAIGVGRRMV